MKYLKNKTMDYLDIDDENIVVYDPDSGNTHYISETGKVMLLLLEAETEFDELVAELCASYCAERAEIESDVREFLDELVAKKVVLTL